jgi:hypothetical protein
MEKSYNSNKLFNAPVEEHITEIIILQLRHKGESLRSLYHMIKARSSQIDPHKEPKKYQAIHSLALEVWELAESTIKCTDEYEYQDLQMFLDEEA